MMKIEVLYEDKDILAINKPAGLVVHSDGKTKEESVSDWLIKNYPEAKEVGEKLGEIEKPGIVHRIDRETSGLLLLAKTKKGYECLKEQFQNREIEKIYHAFLYGKLKEDHGTINLPIGKSASDFRKRSAERGAKGEMREAITYYQVLKRGLPAQAGADFTFVEAKPKTGRTHQIRVHFKALHHPILGDKLYAPKIALRSLGEAGPKFNRLALHAREITFTNVKGQKKSLVAPYPEDFQVALDKIGYNVV